MNSPSKFLSSLSALSLLMTASSCAPATEAPEPAQALATVSQKADAFAITIDGDARTYETLELWLDGNAISLDELRDLLSGGTVLGQEVRATHEGAEVFVDGATASLSAQGLNLEGLKPILETATGPVGVRAEFATGSGHITARFSLMPSNDPAMNEALERAEQMNQLIQDLVQRYPDLAQQNPEEFATQEAAQLEQIATLYCLASGKGPVCTPDTEGGESNRGLLVNWWYLWVVEYILDVTRVGVIPSGTSCPSFGALVEIYHDDEDRKNANSRWGWQGGIHQNDNTLFRFCREDGLKFKPLPTLGSRYNYAVLKLGAACPPGSRDMLRYFDNEDNNNQNYSWGRIGFNVNLLGRGWLMRFCSFTGGLGPLHMSGFPNLGYSYGVFAPTNMPAPYSLQAGYLYKDDEDTFNHNLWVLGPDSMMDGGSNTWMGLARVK